MVGVGGNTIKNEEYFREGEPKARRVVQAP